MPDQLRHILNLDVLAWCKSWDCWPFLLSTAAMDASKVNKTRMLEAAIIGAITVLAGYLFLVPVIEERLNHVSTNVDEVKQDVKDLRREVHNAKIQIGDRWTETDQREHERDHNQRHIDEWRTHDSKD